MTGQKMIRMQSDVPVEAAGTQAHGFEFDVRNGLLATPKFLLPKYFYDEEGARLYEEITRTLEYYPTRTEIGILKASACALARFIPPHAALVEFGGGTQAKMEALIAARPDIAVYAPVDTSPQMLEGARVSLADTYPKLTVTPVLSDFTEAVTLPAALHSHPRVGFFPGSTIGNFSPPEAARLLRTLAKTLGGGSLLIVGVDLVKDPDILNAAYNDGAGVTARFNLNLLARIRRELDSDIDPTLFRHEAVYNPSLSRIEMRLRSTKTHGARIGSTWLTFARDEAIYTESSYKYTIEGFQMLAKAAGWKSLRVLTDERQLFSVHILAQPAHTTRSWSF